MPTQDENSKRLIKAHDSITTGLSGSRTSVSMRTPVVTGIFAVAVALITAAATLLVPVINSILNQNAASFQDRSATLPKPGQHAAELSINSSAPVSPAIDKTRRSSSPSRLVYVNADDIEPSYRTVLIEALHDNKWQVTDDPSRSAIMLHASIDVRVGPGLSVGSTATWQATGSATLQEVANNSDKPPLSVVGQGHAVALRSDSATENAAADALRRAVDEFSAAIRKEGN